MAKHYDWTMIQNYYDLGNTWAEVTKRFGIYSMSIQRAIKRGDLVTRTRTESLLKRKSFTGSQSSVCSHCNTEFSYKPSQQKGLFCSHQCRVDFQWKNETLPKILNGTAGEKVLKKYLVSMCNQCSECGISDWLGKPLMLQMDHRDGNCDNNSLDNVRLLCPNCHTQTDNYGSLNRGKGIVTKRSSRKRQTNSRELVPSSLG